MCAASEQSEATEHVPMSVKAFTPAELNQGFVVAIEIIAKAGEEDVVAGALEALVKPTRAEPGVKLFLPYRSPTDRTAFFIFELYQNEARWAEHQRTAHFKSFVDSMLRASRDVNASLTSHTRRTPRADPVGTQLTSHCRLLAS
jgi:quinol monooxygenase YgiN